MSSEDNKSKLRRTRFESEQITIFSDKSFALVSAALERALPDYSTARLMEYVAHQDREGFEDYVDRVSKSFAIFWSLEQGTAMRLAGIPVESKFYLVGNPVVARGLFEHTGAAGLGAPVRVNISQKDGEKTRIDVESPEAFFKRFPETNSSPVPAMLEDKMLKLFEQIAF